MDDGGKVELLEGRNLMIEVKTVADAEALIGQTLGSGNDQRVITRINDLRLGSRGRIYGYVHWKRPGGKERSIGKLLSEYIAWARKAQQQPVHTLRGVEAFLGTIPEGTELEGFVSRVDDQVTISFKVL